jgi:hypothetical protein
MMTTPSIIFKCPKCGSIKESILDTPEYCSCPGKGQTRAGWDVSGPVSKVRKKKWQTGTRMVKVKVKKSS